MKSDVMPSVVQMEYGDLQELVKEVKETVARDIDLNMSPTTTKQSFGTIDLWNIRRKSRSATSMFRG